MLRMPGVAADAIDLTELPGQVVALIERLQQQAHIDAQELARRQREIALARVKIGFCLSAGTNGSGRRKQ